MREWLTCDWILKLTCDWMLTFAPCSINRFTTLSWPANDEMWRAVLPFCTIINTRSVNIYFWHLLSNVIRVFLSWPWTDIQCHNKRSLYVNYYQKWIGLSSVHVSPQWVGGLVGKWNQLEDQNIDLFGVKCYLQIVHDFYYWTVWISVSSLLCKKNYRLIIFTDNDFETSLKKARTV